MPGSVEEVEHKHVAGLSCSPLSVSLVDLRSGVAVDIDRLCRKESRQTSRRVTISAVQVPLVACAKTVVRYHWNRAREEILTGPRGR